MNERSANCLRYFEDGEVSSFRKGLYLMIHDFPESRIVKSTV